MADDNVAEEAPVTFTVKSSNDAKYSITVLLSSTVSELKEKLSSKEYADLPVERQRLIYSGRVLKDADSLGSYKIKEGHTVHLVKGAASNQQQNPANQGSSSAAPALPTNLSAGTGSNNPLAHLTGARYAGYGMQLPNQDMFGPDGGMGPPPDPEDMVRMLQNPQFASTLNEALSNPQLIDMMIQQNPLLRDMGPQVRQMMQSPEFRRMMTDPEQMRSMMQMQRMFGGGAGGGGMMGMGNGGGNAAFPAPGVTDTTPGAAQGGEAQGGEGIGQQRQQQPQQSQQQQQPPTNPMAALFGGQGAGQGQGANPFAALFNPNLFGNPRGQGGAGSQGNTPSASDLASGSERGQQPQQQQQPQFPFDGGATAAANPFLQNPQLMAQFLSAMNPSSSAPGSGNPDSQGQQQAGGANPFAALLSAMGGAGGSGTANPFNPFGMPASETGGSGGGGVGGANSPDTRPPEERYAEQLGQLNDMGFYEFERNIEALRRTGGSVQGAVEYLLTH